MNVLQWLVSFMQYDLGYIDLKLCSQSTTLIWHKVVTGECS